ncbi:aspartate-semialdehyde dehydrogenase [Pseudomonas aeruginosa]|nr:aspartate-semialdehyde dehydrogenase [Pseudomonas aeruginosa]VFT04672.1 aspartate-semialdehyde dehydrogenase [Pseudomonas aeruginosa]
MLPPIPQGLIPVTVQQDPPKPRPATPPVAPTQAGAGSDGVALRQERDEESWLEEEYRRRQRRQGGEAHARSDEGDEAPADEAGRAPRRTSCRARGN